MRKYQQLKLNLKEEKDKGYSFKDLQSILKKSFDKYKTYKVTYGTRSKQFHLIDKFDRDYNTTFSMPIDDFIKVKNEKDAIDKTTGSRIL